MYIYMTSMALAGREVWPGTVSVCSIIIVTVHGIISLTVYTTGILTIVQLISGHKPISNPAMDAG